MKIIVDAFGGDNAPLEIIAGTLDALKERDDFEAVLVGKKDEIEKLQLMNTLILLKKIKIGG